jgi:hypothetical protein
MVNIMNIAEEMGVGRTTAFWEHTQPARRRFLMLQCSDPTRDLVACE